MKIAILADPLDNQSAGIHVYTKNMIESLLKYDSNNQYVLIRQKHCKEQFSCKQIVVPDFKFPGYASFRLFFIIPYIIKREKVDVVIEPAHFGPFNLPDRIKRITIIHDLTPTLFPQYHRFYSQTLQRIFLKSILKKADAIISNSYNTSKDISKTFSFTKNKIHTIYLGRDDNLSKVKSSESLAKYSITKPYFLYLGTIEPRKNLVTLLKAYQLFREETDSIVQLVIVGSDGWKVKGFYEELKNHPWRKDIIITGFVPDNYKAEFYSNAITFIYPSFYEGFGLPVLEAMSCGTPCIVSDSSSLPEVTGDSALLFDPGNYLCLADKMIMINNNLSLRENLSINGILQSKRFSWDSYTLEFIKVLKEL